MSDQTPNPNEPSPADGRPADFHLPPADRPRNRRRRTPLHQANASADYSRYSTEDQDEVSIESQRIACEERALRDGQAIDPQLRFADEAVSGTKLQRTGLNAMLAAAEQGRFDRLYFFSLSRLARESVIGMPILKRLVNVFKVRVVSVTEGVDTSREGWELQAQILLMQHERYIKELAANVFRGQAFNVARGYSNGDYCLGYMGEDIPGSENTRRGRRALARRKTVVDPSGAKYVLQIFHWFVVERRAIDWIVRCLRESNAPRDHRSEEGHRWSRGSVITVLSNRKYIGDWGWGANKNTLDPETGDRFQEARPAEEVEKYRRILPELRLIEDETFNKAQEYLAKNREVYAGWRDDEGRYVEGAPGAAPPIRYLLSRLIVCGECGKFLIVGGSGAKYLKCPGHNLGDCSTRTHLKRELAEKLILDQVAEWILRDEAWIDEVFAETLAAWRNFQATVPDERRRVEAMLTEMEVKIGRLVDAVESSAEPDPDIRQRLVDRREERRQLRERLNLLTQRPVVTPQEPTREWVVEQLRELHVVLRSGTPAAAHALAALVGGRIVVHEVSVDGERRRFFRGTLKLPPTGVGAMLSQSSPAEDQVASEPILIDFREADPRDAESDRAWTLLQEGMFYLEIAQTLGISKLKLTRLLRRAARRRGVPYVDGRARRSSLGRPTREPSLYMRMADEVGRLIEEGLSRTEIARRLGMDMTTLRTSVVHYYQSRGLPPVDGRERRKPTAPPESRNDPDAA